MLALLLLLSCANNITTLYEEEKALVMGDPGPVPADWEPELRIRLSEGSLQDLAQSALDEGMMTHDDDIEVDNPLGIEVKVNPKAGVDKLTLTVDDRCAGCLKVKARVSGQARWTAGKAKGKVPFSGRLVAGMAFDIVEGKDGWAITGRLTRVDSIKLDDTMAGTVDLSKVLGKWTEQALDKAEPIELGSIGGEDLPLRAVRMGQSEGALEIQGLSRVVGGKAVSASASRPSASWDLRISEDTALALARREAFALGTMDYDVAADPRSLTFDGQSFTMGLRLWRLKGAGWWRDYSVTGDVKVGKEKIRLVPEEATEGEKSKGAGIADPLALLVEGRILQAVTDGMAQAFPGSTKARIGKHRIVSTVESVTGRSGVVLVRGSMVLNVMEGGRLPADAGEVRPGLR